MPTLLASKDGKERLVFNGYWKMTFSLYDEPTDQPQKTIPGAEKPVTEPTRAQALPKFEPDIQVTIDNANKEKYGGFKFFLEDASSYVGVDSTQTVLGRVVLSFSDYLGDKRIIANLSSIESFSNFDFIYADLSHRRNWQVEVFDTRTYFLAQNVAGFVTRDKAAFSETGAVASLVYPFSFYRRAEIVAGYILRKIDFQSFAQDLNGNFIPVISPRDDNFPIVSGALTGDSAVFAPWGPITGRRWRLEASYAPNLKSSERGTLQSNADLDFRQYIPVTRRSNLALRVFLGEAGGQAPTPYFFGGLDTLRGFDFRSLVGDRAGFANVEFRFPMVDLLATPFLGFQGIRGVLFMDVGGAYFKNGPPFKFYNSDLHSLQDGVASYGYGVTVNLFGLDLNWDFAKQYDFKQSHGGYRSAFWIGTRF